MDISDLIDLIQPLWNIAPIPLIIVVLILGYALLFPDKAEKVAAWFFRTFAFFSNRFERRGVKHELQSTLNNTVIRINNQSSGAIPFKMKIEWVKKKTREAFLKDDEIIVAMDYSYNQDRNLVSATMAYLPKAVLPFSRIYISPTTIKSIDFTIAKKIFATSDTAMTEFFEEIVKPEIQTSKSLKKFCKKMDNINQRGLFSRILLHELSHMGTKLYPNTPDENIAKEANKLVLMLDNLAKKEKGIDIHPTLNQNYIKASVMLIGRSHVIESKGQDPYLKWLYSCIDKGIEMIYLLASGSLNIRTAENVRKHAISLSNIKLIKQEKYTMRGESKTYKAICIALRNKEVISN